MPELPEVENVKRTLAANLLDSPVVIEVKSLSPKLRVSIPKSLPAKINGKKLRSLQRRAKYILFEFDDGYLLSHLGMTGFWRFEERREVMKHDHFELRWSNNRYMVYNDPRRFGLITWVDAKFLDENSWLKNLGPEPFNQQTFTSQYLFALSRKRIVPIKSFLMDQTVVVGVGNIYASEALHLAGISPVVQVKKLKIEHFEKIIATVREVLQKSIDLGGSTISDYQNANGGAGEFQSQFKVYDRAALPCTICETPIKMRRIAGRSTFWCPHCQPMRVSKK